MLLHRTVFALFLYIYPIHFFMLDVLVKVYLLNYLIDYVDRFIEKCVLEDCWREEARLEKLLSKPVGLRLGGEIAKAILFVTVFASLVSYGGVLLVTFPLGMFLIKQEERWYRYQNLPDAAEMAGERFANIKILIVKAKTMEEFIEAIEFCEDYIERFDINLD